MITIHKSATKLLVSTQADCSLAHYVALYSNPAQVTRHVVYKSNAENHQVVQKARTLCAHYAIKH